MGATIGADTGVICLTVIESGFVNELVTIAEWLKKIRYKLRNSFLKDT
jgi:hypothetical protein